MIIIAIGPLLVNHWIVHCSVHIHLEVKGLVLIFKDMVLSHLFRVPSLKLETNSAASALV